MARGDGRLHDLLPGEKGPQDACGVFGVWAPGEDVAKLAYYGLYALQHRGQESAGIATSDGRSILVYKDMGLVSQVFDERSLGSLKGHRGGPLPLLDHRRVDLGERPAHPRGPRAEHRRPDPQRQPDQLLRSCANSSRRGAWRASGPRGRAASRQHHRHRPGHRPAVGRPRPLLEAAALDVLPRLRGAFCFVFMDEHTLYAARDPRGSARWSSAGSSAAGSSPPRPPRSTSSAPR